MRISCMNHRFLSNASSTCSSEAATENRRLTIARKMHRADGTDKGKCGDCGANEKEGLEHERGNV